MSTQIPPEGSAPPGPAPSGIVSATATSPAPVARPSSTGYAVEVSNLTKIYRSRKGRHVAVDHLTMNVPLSGVHGFLGPNGAGKTTTIRMLLGLIHATEGRMRLFGQEVPAHLPAVINRVGAIVEQPKFFPNFSARNNLELEAAAIGADKRRVGEVLEAVGLSDRARDPFKTYSLGMKQRLAIAGTLLKNPDLLVFDEPTNGLDPAGIQEIRQTLRSLGQQGKCVLVSSHILSEVQQVADTVSIIGRGKLLAEGHVNDILSTHASSLRVVVDDPQRAAGVLMGGGFQCHPDDAGRVVVDGSPDGRRVNQLLVQAGLFASELTPLRPDLESVFLELTQGQGPGTYPGVGPATTSAGFAPAVPQAPGGAR